MKLTTSDANRLFGCLTKLKEVDNRATYFIAKEIAMIELNGVFYPEKNTDSKARLKSLAQHVNLTFKGNSDASELAKLLKEAAAE